MDLAQSVGREQGGADGIAVAHVVVRGPEELLGFPGSSQPIGSANSFITSAPASIRAA
jgi:hypothetical protein